MHFVSHLYSIFYGAETWYSALRQNDFHKIGVVYHRAVKKTVGWSE